MNIKNRTSNKLVDEKSPYLLQHAFNPVDWYPWGDEAFAKAHQENKPIFLSIGYSTCHWCHVMERESFEDEEVATLLNRYFVAIKVDREERPDIDHIYMAFCQGLTGSGGWPLTILMTPEKRPFFAGTYFPKNRRYGRQGLLEILEQVGSLWVEDDHKLRGAAEEIFDAVQAHTQTKTAPLIDNDPSNAPLLGQDASLIKEQGIKLINEAFSRLAHTFDNRYGGFGPAPKFPSPHVLGFLLRYALTEPDSSALTMVRKTLDGIARGGMYDHIGFGFARYSTDEKWLVPHFEKMLYDNALLAYVFLEGYQMTHNDDYRRVAEEILTYIERDMTAPEGGFYSAEDADSESEEGKFYVWSPEEIIEILGLEQGKLYCAAYDITPAGNFEGKSIPNTISSDLQLLAQEYSLSLEELKASLSQARQTLFLAREGRIHPHKDDKILTSWNGLMIAALAKGAQILQTDRYLRLAEHAADFILKNLRRPDGRLLARYRDGEAAYPAYLDDYAYLIWGLLELYSAQGQSSYLETALELQQEQDRLFSDEQNGGYYLTGTDAEELLIRPHETYDGATPSGNSVSALNLLRLARLTGDTQWDEKAAKALSALMMAAVEYPTGYTASLQVLQFSLYPGQEIVLASRSQAEELPAFRKTFFSDLRPYSTLLYQDGSLEEIPWLKDYPIPDAGVTAYVCQNFACQQPVQTPEEFQSLMSH
ncbi:MAG: thioredoxin domain-containing protein [Desulfitobacteriaceae bacterium]